MKTGKVVVSVLLAATAGVALGMLFAPEKGVKTRKKIRRKSEDYLDDLKDEYASSVKSLKRKVDSVYDDIATKIKGHPDDPKETKS